MSTSKTGNLPAYLVPTSYTERKSSGDSAPGKESYSILAGHSWDDCWELVSDLHVEIKASDEEEVIAICLNLQEYGIGDSLESAIADLLTSLSDYLQSLESREASLSPSAAKDLQILKSLLKTTADSVRGR